MIEIILSDLNKTNFYEETLKSIESICDDYGIGQHFGTLSMVNQMVCDYLDGQTSYSVDVAFQIESDEVSFNYTLHNASFRLLAENDLQDNTGLFVLRTLADEVSFSSDSEMLTTTFHVKTRMHIQRNVQQEKVRSLFANIQ